MKKRYLFLGLFLLLIAYLTLWPVPIDPEVWEPPTAPALEGVYEKNEKLAAIERLFEGQCYKCEDLAIDTFGRVYGGAETGEVYRFDLEKGTREELVNTGGRPLGLDMDTLGNLIIADTEKGLWSLNPNTKELTLLTDKFGDYRIKFADDVEVADDGMMYFSDASNKFGYFKNTLDIAERRANGTLFSYNPSTNETAVVLPDLYFANGVATSPDSAFVLVNETSAYRTMRYWLKGSKKGTSEVFIDNLPGFPDGISRGEDGIYWLALISPRKADLDELFKSKFLRKLILRLPESIQPAPTHYSFILGLNSDGEVVYNLQDPNAKWAEITSVQQYGDYLYLGSLYEDGIARYKFR